MRVIGISNKGLKKKVNEDCYSIDDRVFYDSNCDLDTAKVICVCDGVSTSNEAKNSSNFVCEEISKNLDSLLSEKDTVLRTNIDKINTKLMKKYKDGHTTLAGIAIGDDYIKIINIGDTKVYTLKDNKLTKVSKDDTYYEYLKSINDISYLNYEKSHIITACMGAKNFIKRELHLNKITNEFKKGDCLVICSDGITDMIGEDKLEYFLSIDESLEVKLDKIEKRVNFKGAKDNYTIVVVGF